MRFIGIRVTTLLPSAEPNNNAGPKFPAAWFVGIAAVNETSSFPIDCALLAEANDPSRSSRIQKFLAVLSTTLILAQLRPQTHVARNIISIQSVLPKFGFKVWNSSFRGQCAFIISPQLHGLLYGMTYYRESYHSAKNWRTGTRSRVVVVGFFFSPQLFFAQIIEIHLRECYLWFGLTSRRLPPK
jgi:hypothetical protein